MVCQCNVNFQTYWAFVINIFFFNVALLFFPISSGNMNLPGHVLPQIGIDSYSNVNLCLVIYVMACLWCTQSLRKMSDGSEFSCLLNGNSR